MNDSTRSLQDIYLSACKSFDEVADKLISGYISAIDSALAGYEDQEIQAKAEANKAHEDREQEVQISLNESLAVISNSVELTLSENQAFRP